MPSVRTMLAIAAALTLSLAGCANASNLVADPAALGRICPAPTPAAKLAPIAAYLEKAGPDDGLDVLATEWERLDEGARLVRRGRE